MTVVYLIKISRRVANNLDLFFGSRARRGKYEWVER